LHAVRFLLRLALRLVVLSAGVWALRAALRRWIDGPTGAQSAPAWTPAPTASTRQNPPTEGLDAPASGAVSEGSASSGEMTSPAWVEPEPDGSAPASHPVKVKLSSRLYHSPGMSAYERTKADRCYASEEAAEADGFTRARR